MMYSFRPVTPADLSLVFDWLDTPHIQEFWDNSQAHLDDIAHFTKGRPSASPYFNGMNHYWLGLHNHTPFAFIITHEENDTTDPPAYFRPYLAKEGLTIGLDFCIGSPAFIGKKMAASTLKAFMTFYVKDVAPTTKTFLIDPFLSNPRAVHVYEKAGFQKVCTFEQENGYFQGRKGILMTCTPSFSL